MFESALAVYLVSGGILFVAGPGRMAVAREVANTRALPNRFFEGRILAFRAILTAAIVLIWPIFLVAYLRERKARSATKEERQASISEGLRFSLMGGSGTLSCNDCRISEEITAFLHGYLPSGKPCCTTGYQCLSCGQFIGLGSEESPLGKDTPCECGGTLSRDHVLFCPNCRSKQLSYRLDVIS